MLEKILSLDLALTKGGGMEVDLSLVVENSRSQILRSEEVKWERKLNIDYCLKFHLELKKEQRGVVIIQLFAFILIFKRQGIEYIINRYF